MNALEATGPVTDLPTLRASTRATITRAEAAEVVGVDVRTITRAVEAGELPALRLGRRVLIPREPLLQMLTDGAPVSDAAA